MYILVHKVQLKKSIAGAAILMLMLALTLLVSTYLVINIDIEQIQLKRQVKIRLVLAKAKEALLYYTIMKPASSMNRVVPKHPGTLICPDINGDGVSTVGMEFLGSSCASYYGWFPWKTLRTGELKDAGGERLWLVIAKGFQSNRRTAFNSSNMMSDLRLDGDTVAAIILAPGSRLGMQTRQATTLANIGDYLDGENADLDTDYVSPDGVNVNDQLITITVAEIRNLIEPIVFKQVVALLADYYSHNEEGIGYLPYATDNSNYECTSNSSALFGVLPLVDNGCDHKVLDFSSIAASVKYGWIVNNDWHKAMIYSVAPECQPTTEISELNCSGDGGALTVNAHKDIKAFIAFPGPELSAVDTSSCGSSYDQSGNRPSINVCDYFEAEENVNGDNMYVSMSLGPVNNNALVALEKDIDKNKLVIAKE